MTTKRYRVKLTAEAREELKALTAKGRVSARKRTHARILLQCDEGREDGGRTVRLRRPWALAYRRWCECAGVVWRRDWRRP